MAATALDKRYTFAPDEKLIRLSDFQRQCSEADCVSTVRRWAKLGCLNRYTGERIKLPTKKGPSCLMTSFDAYRWLLERLNENS